MGINQKYYGFYTLATESAPKKYHEKTKFMRSQLHFVKKIPWDFMYKKRAE